MSVIDSPLFRQWNLLQNDVMPDLIRAEEEHGTPTVWSVGNIADAVALTVAYDHANASARRDRHAIWAFASETDTGMHTMGFSLSDIRCVPAARRSASFRHDGTGAGWVPQEDVANRVVLAKPNRPVDLVAVRRDDVTSGFVRDELPALLRDGGRVLITDGPGTALGTGLMDGLRPVDAESRMWLKPGKGGAVTSRNSRRQAAPAGETLTERQRQARLIESHLRLAHSLANRFSHHGESKDDLEQVAMLALVKAARRFDPSRQTCFSTYATASVLGEIKRHFRDRTWMLRVPRSIQETYLAVKDSRETLTHDLGSSPTVQQIAAHLKVSEVRVLEAMEAGDNYWPESLDVGVFEGESVREIPVVDPSFDQAMDRTQLRELLPRLEQREQLILKRIFFDGWTQRMVAEEIGVSQMQVSRLLLATVSKLRKWFEGEAA